MTDERLILAIGRLERALSRIESKVQAGPQAADVDALGMLRQRYDELEQRHHRLRERTGAAAERLSKLLESLAEAERDG